jgi:hypothetical protein
MRPFETGRAGALFGAPAFVETQGRPPIVYQALTHPAYHADWLGVAARRLGDICASAGTLGGAHERSHGLLPFARCGARRLKRGRAALQSPPAASGRHSDACRLRDRSTAIAVSLRRRLRRFKWKAEPTRPSVCPTSLYARRRPVTGT